MRRKETEKTKRADRAYPIKLRQEVWDFLDALAARHPELHLSQIFEQAVDLFRLHCKVLGYGGVMRQLDARIALELYAVAEEVVQRTTESL